MEIKGSIEDVVFRNAENGYSVIVMDCGGDPVTAVGIFPPLANGEMLVLTGEWSDNHKFGRQFNAETVKITRPGTKEAMCRYLASGLFRGIGDVTAASIVEEFGEETLEVIERRPAKLTKVRGMSAKKAMELSEQVRALKEMQATILYLQSYDVSLNLAIKIYKTYEAATRNTVERNPYQMVDDVDGVGFVTADKIASRLGIEKTSRFRITAGIVYVLQDASNRNGHTYLPKSALIEESAKLLEIPLGEYADTIVSVLEDCVVMGKIMILSVGDEDAVMLARCYLTEYSLARKTVGMMNGCKPLLLDVKTDLSVYQKENGITLHENQIKAIENCIGYGVNVITGGPGTGKTTIVKCIITMLKKQNMTVCLCAPTGRAAKRLSQATGEDAKTIHRLLDLNFGDGKGHFTYNENTRLDADVVIVDEVSMCDETLFNALISAIKQGGRLIMVGDKDQLPSVGAGNVLADMIASGCVPVNYLTQIYRQGENSRIIDNAHRINRGEMPVLDNRSKDFFFDNQASPASILKNAIDMVTTRIPKFAGVTSKDIQVLCPMKKGIAGVENVNAQMQNALNPVTDPKSQIKVGLNTLRVGDKIIHTVNNYQMEWRNDEENTAGTGVYNGDIGYIIGVDPSEPSAMVRFEDGKIVKYRQGEFDQITLAYAISIHKSQGSEFDVVIIAVTGGNYMIMTRNLLYTAVTRAKKMAVLIGDYAAVDKMVHNNYTARRYTMLVDFLKKEQEKTVSSIL